MWTKDLPFHIFNHDYVAYLTYNNNAYMCYNTYMCYTIMHADDKYMNELTYLHTNNACYYIVPYISLLAVAIA